MKMRIGKTILSSEREMAWALINIMSLRKNFLELILDFCCGVRNILFKQGDLIELAEKAQRPYRRTK